MGVWKDKETRSWTYTVSHYGKRDIYERQNLYDQMRNMWHPNSNQLLQPPVLFR
jgi:hypothetical protein